MLETLPSGRRLVVLNYHRIGDAEQAVYDPEVYSATVDDFEQQVTFLKSTLGILSLDEALEWLEQGKSRARAAALITFDDGYIDNFQLAFPVLRSLGTTATFFLPTSFVGTNHLPWWDVISYCVRHATSRHLNLSHLDMADIDLEATSTKAATRAILACYRSPKVTDSRQFLNAIEVATGVIPPTPDRTFLDWNEAAEMIAGGMSIGSHTHRHEVLAKLPLDEQVRELKVSRRMLEEKLSIRGDVLAYPVGGRDAFSQDSFAALEQADYRAAFSYYGGTNRPASTNRFDIRRMAVDSDLSTPLVRMRVAIAAATGRVFV